MKLFIWEGDGVLTDYGNGMIVAVAEDLQGALEVVRLKDGCAMGSFPADRARIVDLGNAKPEAWLCWGSG